MVGPYLGTAPGGAGLAAPGTGLSGAVGLRRGLGRRAGFSEGVTVYAAVPADFTLAAPRRGETET